MKTIEQRHIDKLMEMATEPVDYTDLGKVSKALAYLRGYVQGVVGSLSEVAFDDYAEDLMMRRTYGRV